jgi:hypothetical protein
LDLVLEPDPKLGLVKPNLILGTKLNSEPKNQNSTRTRSDFQNWNWNRKPFSFFLQEPEPEVVHESHKPANIHTNPNDSIPQGCCLFRVQGLRVVLRFCLPILGEFMAH